MRSALLVANPAASESCFLIERCDVCQIKNQSKRRALPRFRLTRMRVITG